MCVYDHLRMRMSLKGEREQGREGTREGMLFIASSCAPLAAYLIPLRPPRLCPAPQTRDPWINGEHTALPCGRSLTFLCMELRIRVFFPRVAPVELPRGFLRVVTEWLTRKMPAGSPAALLSSGPRGSWPCMRPSWHREECGLFRFVCVFFF